MKIAQFKKMLSLYGADMTRWESVDMDSARAFIEGSPQAQELYRQAQALDTALDTFKSDLCDPALLDQVMGKIGANGSTQKTAAILSFPAARKTLPVSRPAFWGGVAAIAAMIILFVSVLTELDFSVPSSLPSQGTKLAVNATTNVSGTQDVEIVLATLEQLSEEEIAQREMMGLLQTASSAQQAGSRDIDSFLNEILSDAPAHDGAQEEMDLWQMFLESQDVREL